MSIVAFSAPAHANAKTHAITNAFTISHNHRLLRQVPKTIGEHDYRKAQAFALYTALNLAGRPIAGRTVYVIPILNVSGYNHNRRWESVKVVKRGWAVIRR